eukprot:3660_1
MSNSNKKLKPERYYVCHKQENQWCIVVLKETLDKVETGHYFIKTLNKAMYSIHKTDHIISMKTANDVKIFIDTVLFIGPRIAKCLKDAYDRNYSNYVERAHEYIHQAKSFNAKYNAYVKTRASKRKPNSRGGPYIPRTGTGNWAILVTLPRLVDEECIQRWNINDEQNKDPILFDEDKIKHESQEWANASMTKKVNGHYTAFSGVRDYLIPAGYIKLHGDSKAWRYELTSKGYIIGIQLLEEYNVNKEMNTENDISDYSDNEFENKNDYNASEPPRKKQKINVQKYGGVRVSIIDNHHENYKLTDPIKLSNGKKYLLYLIIDPREKVNSESKQLDIYKALKNDSNILVSDNTLSTGDFCWLLINIDCPYNDDEKLILPFLIERKTWNDLYMSIYKDGRYEQQKYRMSFVMDNDKIMVGGRKIYLMEGKAYKDDVQECQKEICEQSIIDTEVLDLFHVYKTDSKHETLKQLVNWTFMMRHWINGGYSKGMDGFQSYAKYLFDVNALTSFAVFNEFTKANLIDDLSPRMRWMEQLLKVPGCSEKHAYYISKTYGTMGKLCDAYDDCEAKWNGYMKILNRDNNDDYKCPFVSTVRGPCGSLNTMEMDYCPRCGKKRPEFTDIIMDMNENKLNENKNNINIPAACNISQPHEEKKYMIEESSDARGNNNESESDSDQYEYRSPPPWSEDQETEEDKDDIDDEPEIKAVENKESINLCLLRRSSSSCLLAPLRKNNTCKYALMLLVIVLLCFKAPVLAAKSRHIWNVFKGNYPIRQDNNNEYMNQQCKMYINQSEEILNYETIMNNHITMQMIQEYKLSDTYDEEYSDKKPIGSMVAVIYDFYDFKKYEFINEFYDFKKFKKAAAMYLKSFKPQTKNYDTVNKSVSPSKAVSSYQIHQFNCNKNNCKCYC